MVLVDGLLVALSLPLVAAASYLLALTLASRRPPAPPYATPHLRFDLVVPAHDEQEGIAATVRSLLAVAYPAALRRVIVVADNCGDATAERARAAGAQVLVRTDPERRGKGFALAHAFAWILGDGFADAVVVVDADTVVSPNLLSAFAARLDAGATAVQSDNTVGNPDASWRTRLMAVAFVLVNTLRLVGRDRLGCSVGLHGNGMCFATRLLREIPHEAFSVVEDVEYGIRIGEQGHRVRFAHEASVASVMVTSSSAAGPQRRRWELGRMALARRHGLALVRRGLARRDRVLVDLGLDLLVPPLAFLGAAAVAGTALSLGIGAIAGRAMIATWTWGASLCALVVYVGRGWRMSGTGWRGLAGLLHAPVYLVWKVWLYAARPAHRRGAWVRTDRERTR